jgi:Type IV secretion system pilin
MKVPKLLSTALPVLVCVFMTSTIQVFAATDAECKAKNQVLDATTKACVAAPAATGAASSSGRIQFEDSGTGNGVDSFEGCTGLGADSPLCRDITSTSNPLFGESGILTTVANIFAILTGVISVFMVIIGGMKYINSAGDSAKTATAKNTIMYAAIGMGVAISAGGIVRFVLNRL